jgi:hypothetical protein
MKYIIIAGSSYGLCSATYTLVNNKLSLIESDPSDNLDGNGIVTEFDGLTLDQAAYKIKYENERSTPGHTYDGCHACQWRVWLEQKS